MEHKGSHNIGSKVIEKLAGKDISAKRIVLPKNPYARVLVLAYKLLFERFDFVHLEVYSGRYFRFVLPLTMPLIRLRRKKVLFNLAGGSLPEYFLINEKIVRKYLLMADISVSPSRRIISFFAQKIPALNIKYLPNFIDIEKFPYQYKESMAYKVLWVRAFDITYNPDHAIRALKILQERFPKASLTMIGPDKGLLKACEILVNQLEVGDKVVFEGTVHNNDLYKYFHSHDVFINTPAFESFGFALAEAAASGIPLVSYNAGEIPFLWKDGHDILICQSGEPTGLAQQIAVLFDNPKLTKELSTRARRKAEKFSWDSFSADFFALIQKFEK